MQILYSAVLAGLGQEHLGMAGIRVRVKDLASVSAGVSLSQSLSGKIKQCQRPYCDESQFATSHHLAGFPTDCPGQDLDGYDVDTDTDRDRTDSYNPGADTNSRPAIDEISQR